MTDSFSKYKDEILEQYEKKKLGFHTSFLMHPTRAGLRDLSVILLREDDNLIDRQIFESFLSFEFNAGSQKLKNETDRFRPVATFFKKETSLSDIAAADMAALLVGFQPRPYGKYLKRAFVEAEKLENGEETAELNSIELEMLPKAGSPKVTVAPRKIDEPPTKEESAFKRKAIIAISLTVALTISYAVKKEVFPAKECLQWNNDRYETVICEGSVPGSPIIPQKNNPFLAHLRKIKVGDTTQFFMNGKPLVWYSKQGHECEFFNAPGVHPITQKPLLPITRHIITEHILTKKTP